MLLDQDKEKIMINLYPNTQKHLDNQQKEQDMINVPIMPIQGEFNKDTYQPSSEHYRKAVEVYRNTQRAMQYETEKAYRDKQTNYSWAEDDWYSGIDGDAEFQHQNGEKQ